MKACKDIDFLDGYWIEAKRIAQDVKDNLAQGIGGVRKPLYSNGGAKMYIVKFSDLKNTWLPSDIINNVCGKSSTLEALANKIQYMIQHGRADAIKRMVEAIVKDNKKKLTRKYLYGSGDFLGYGHFKWNSQSYVLNTMEIKHLKNYFKL